ncbi:superoxide dismutase [Phyllobacterium ifriqiyense]|uniref:superoxide dismutase n=1 Tax=Phyllobacterium ifriqiyense TaxID=314238 RepID=UPI00339B6A12
MQILAIMTGADGRTEPDFLPYQMEEERTVWRHWKGGLLRQMWFRTDRLGAIFILEAESLEAVERILPEFPMIRDGLLVADLIPLRNFDGLEALFADPWIAR